MLKPKHSFQKVVTELVEGFRNGEIALESNAKLEAGVKGPLIEVHLAKQEFASQLKMLWKAQIDVVATRMASRVHEILGDRSRG